MSQKTRFILANKVYDVFKILDVLVLPGLGMLYFAGYLLWGLPLFKLFYMLLFASMAVLGLALVISSNHYALHKKYDGYLDVSQNDTSKIHQLEIITPPEHLETQPSVTFKVRKIGPDTEDPEDIPSEWAGM